MAPSLVSVSITFRHPIRVSREMARVVRPGGWVVIGDQITDDDQGGAAWHQEIEVFATPPIGLPKGFPYCGRWELPSAWSWMRSA